MKPFSMDVRTAVTLLGVLEFKLILRMLTYCQSLDILYRQKIWIAQATDKHDEVYVI